ncbi:MAG: hypothetical protein MZV65_44715 [Chromatiales bacterium]|nr:hypothetical protein [Chromatiales bacterium]
MPFDGPPWLSDGRHPADRGVGRSRGRATPRCEPRPAAGTARGCACAAGWTPDGRLDGLPLAIGSGTRIDYSSRAGDYVEMRGGWKRTAASASSACARR